MVVAVSVNGKVYSVSVNELKEGIDIFQTVWQHGFGYSDLENHMLTGDVRKLFLNMNIKFYFPKGRAV